MQNDKKTKKKEYFICVNRKSFFLAYKLQKVSNFFCIQTVEKRKKVKKCIKYIPGKSHGSNLIKSTSPMAIELKLASVAFLRR